MMQFTRLSDLRGSLLESPVWDATRNCLYLCDIEAGLIHALDLDGKILGQWDMGDKVASLGLCESGRLVVALSRQVVLFDPETAARSPLWQGFDEPQSSRLNDGKVGPDGAFWVGSMDGRDPRQSRSNLYRIDATAGRIAIAGGIVISNGLAWSADGRRMFLSDSRGPWIDRIDFDPATGDLGDRHRIAELDEARGRPDGGATDMQGYYWSAGVSAGVINRFDAVGQLERQVDFPAPAPTMPCFCGPDLRQMVVTSHRLGDDNPLSGGVFIATAPVSGVAVQRMRGV